MLRTDRQTDRHTDADDRYTHVTTVGVSTDSSGERKERKQHQLTFYILHVNVCARIYTVTIFKKNSFFELGTGYGFFGLPLNIQS